MQADLVTLYTSPGCSLCDTAFDELRALAREFSFKYQTVTIHPYDHVPDISAVPAIRYNGVVYVGSNWPKRLRIAMLDKTTELSHATKL